MISGWNRTLFVLQIHKEVKKNKGKKAAMWTEIAVQLDVPDMQFVAKM